MLKSDGERSKIVKTIKLNFGSINIWAVVVAQLVKRLLLIPEFRGSFPVIGKNLFIYIEHLFTVNCVLERRKIKEKRAGDGPFFKKNFCKI